MGARVEVPVTPALFLLDKNILTLNHSLTQL